MKLFLYEQDQPSYINIKIKYNETKCYNNNKKIKIKKSRMKSDAEAGSINHTHKSGWSKARNQLELVHATG